MVENHHLIEENQTLKDQLEELENIKITLEEKSVEVYRLNERI